MHIYLIITNNIYVLGNIIVIPLNFDLDVDPEDSSYVPSCSDEQDDYYSESNVSLPDPGNRKHIIYQRNLLDLLDMVRKAYQFWDLNHAVTFGGTIFNTEAMREEGRFGHDSSYSTVEKYI